MPSRYNFQFCQKLILFSEDWSKVFLAKRQGEADYDGTYSFICGKMETTDVSIAAGLKREKDEEVGKQFRVKVYMDATNNVLYRKNDGNSMILPHYVAQYVVGEVILNEDEYSDYAWIPVKDLASFEPKVETITEIVAWALRFKDCLGDSDFLEI
jgi:8-oxo-dGTP pyrophosphatase MutT (NUDIX family)